MSNRLKHLLAAFDARMHAARAALKGWSEIANDFRAIAEYHERRANRV